jgi:3-oxoacyl-[acyl-carrier-protein] synthase I
MSAIPIAILKTGLVTSVGLSAPATCSAIRAKLTNPSETRFIDSSGEWIMAHQVMLKQPWRGLTKLAKMAVMAIEEALEDIPKEDWRKIPLLLCVAEPERPGRIDGLDDQLFLNIQDQLDARFSKESAVVAHGRVSVAVALAQARQHLAEGKCSHVLIAATDSLLNWSTLSYYSKADRLLNANNSNGFMPGEGAGTLLVGADTQSVGELVCIGIGFAREAAHLDSEEPLRADGLTQAMKAALVEATCDIDDIGYRISSLSGEQYYFKEASLALNRTRPKRKENFDLWHPAESIGEAGSAAAIACFALGQAANTKGYSPGSIPLIHFSNDLGARAVVVLRANQ